MNETHANDFLVKERPGKLMRKYAIRCFRVYLCMMPLAMVNKGTFIFLQALGKARESMILSLVREIIFGVFLPILLPLAFALNGVLYSFPVADVLTFILSLIVILGVYGELDRSPFAGAVEGAVSR